jgi:hypothetical protein
VSTERLLSIREIYHEYNMASMSLTERMFRNEPGVIRMTAPGRKKASIRVPQSVVDRVMLRMTVPPRRQA